MKVAKKLVEVALPLDAIKKDLVERYARAGWPGGLTDDELVALSLITGVILMFLTLGAALLIKPPFAFLCVIGLLLGPGLVSNDLSGKAKARELAISRTLPFVLDLLVLTIRAGASLTMAMERVALDYDRHPIGQEFRATLGDIELGVTTRDSFKALGERNANVPSLRAFVDDLIQSEELGRPIADTLQRLSDGTRARRISEATAAAGNAKVMVLVPGMLIFIATLIILFAPFAVKYYYGGFSPDGQWLVSGSHDKTLRIWRAATGHEVETLRGHTRVPWRIVFDPSARTLISCGNGELRRWDIKSGEMLQAERVTAQVLHALASSPDGRLLATAGLARRSRLSH